MCLFNTAYSENSFPHAAHWRFMCLVASWCWRIASLDGNTKLHVKHWRLGCKPRGLFTKGSSAWPHNCNAPFVCNDKTKESHVQSVFTFRKLILLQISVHNTNMMQHSMFSQIQYDSFASVYYSFKNKRHTPGKIKIFITSITLMFTNTKPMEKMSSVYTLQTITEWDTWMINFPTFINHNKSVSVIERQFCKQPHE